MKLTETGCPETESMKQWFTGTGESGVYIESN